jgi:hypothetical protein
MKWILFFCFLLAAGFASAQETVRLGPDEIASNQSWTITISVKNARLKSYDAQPEIAGFRKRGTSPQSSTTIINGQVSSEESVIMHYTPIKEGVVTVPSLTFTVNGKPIKVNGKKVKVGPPARRSADPFDSFFERSPADDFFGNEEPEFVEVKDDALLMVSTSRSEVYVGEGFNVTLSFLIADNNRAQLQFYDIDKQLTAILKQLRPANCWEEDFTNENIEGQSIMINGKHYTQYKLHEAMYYPFNTEPIRFPSLNLEMIKYKIAKNPSFFGRNRQEDFKTYKSEAKTVRVKPLPPHPLGNSVAVGDYKLRERIGDTHLQTGNSVSYEFNIYGEGNFAAVNKPQINTDDDAFEFYDPTVQQEISKERNRLTGSKSFRYFMIPREPGKYNLGKYFHWIFFNPTTSRYDTLRSNTSVSVEGESKKNEVIQSSDRENRTWTFWLFSGFIAVMFGGSIVLLFKK